MNPHILHRLSDEDLVKTFIEVANQLGEAVINWESGVNETKRLFAIEKILRDRGTATRLKLMPLLDDENRFVQYYAANHLMALAPERCRQIIEANAKRGDAIAGDAGMHLHALDTGFSKPD